MKNNIHLEHIIGSDFPKVKVAGGYNDSTVRFVDGTACCTAAYSFKMTTLEQAGLARRIVAALNATRHLNIAELEAASHD